MLPMSHFSRMTDHAHGDFSPIFGCTFNSYRHSDCLTVSATRMYRDTECFNPLMVTGDASDYLLMVIWNIDALEK